MAGGLKTTIKIGSKPVKGYYSKIRKSGINPVFGRTNNPVLAINTQSRMANELADALAGAAIELAGQNRDLVNQRKVLVSAIRYAANVEARRLIDFVTAKMIGTRGAAHGVTFKDSYLKQGMKTGQNWKPAFPTGGSISWAQLSLRRLHEKRDDRYFVDTGALKLTLQSMRSSYPAALGGIQVREKDYTRAGMKKLISAYQDGVKRQVALGSIEVTIFPNASPNLFPGLVTGRWDQIDLREAALEASTFMPGNIREKLSGPRRGGFAYRFRPMMGPVTQFWMMHRIPAAIAIAISNGTRLRDRSDDWMK